MAKGVTNQPLHIHVAPEWYDHPAVLDLRRQGHQVHDMARVTSATADLILHPAAHGWNDAMWDYLPAAITAARRRRKKEKK